MDQNKQSLVFVTVFRARSSFPGICIVNLLREFFQHQPNFALSSFGILDSKFIGSELERCFGLCYRIAVPAPIGLYNVLHDTPFPLPPMLSQMSCQLSQKKNRQDCWCWTASLLTVRTCCEYSVSTVLMMWADNQHCPPSLGWPWFLLH